MICIKWVTTRPGFPIPFCFVESMYGLSGVHWLRRRDLGGAIFRTLEQEKPKAEDRQPQSSAETLQQMTCSQKLGRFQKTITIFLIVFGGARVSVNFKACECWNAWQEQSRKPIHMAILATILFSWLFELCEDYCRGRIGASPDCP